MVALLHVISSKSIGVTFYLINLSMCCQSSMQRNFDMGKINEIGSKETKLPLIINTWDFISATHAAWQKISVQKGTALDSIEAGCTTCEEFPCAESTGFGGSPDEHGETTLDAMIMDGSTHQVGAVAALRRVKKAICVARAVMQYTTHTLLVGEKATQFAISMGFPEESLTTKNSKEMHRQWLKAKCQPNFWRGNLQPDSSVSCGPYSPIKDNNFEDNRILSEATFNAHNHDTIGMLAIDANGNIAGGTTTNGARNKIPGRVGDSSIPGSGAYVDGEVGGASATGDGDVLMRFAPSLLTVEGMRNGESPSKSAEKALRRVAVHYPNFKGAIVAATVKGEFGAACYGFSEFPFAVASDAFGGVKVFTVPCFT